MVKGNNLKKAETCIIFFVIRQVNGWTFKEFRKCFILFYDNDYVHRNSGGFRVCHRGTFIPLRKKMNFTEYIYIYLMKLNKAETQQYVYKVGYFFIFFWEFNARILTQCNTHLTCNITM